MFKARVDDIRAQIEAVSPKLNDLTVNVLFGDVWERPGLSKRDRLLITVAAMTAMGKGEHLAPMLGRALEGGVKKEEISELITHLAFYCGWPNAAGAARVAKQIFDEYSTLK